MSRTRLTSLLVAVVLLTGSCLVAQEPPPEPDRPVSTPQIQTPNWLDMVMGLMAIVGMGVLLVASVTRVLRGRLLEQVHPNFTPWGLIEIIVLAGIWLFMKTAPSTAIVALTDWTAETMPIWVIFSVETAAGLVVLSLSIWLLHARYGIWARSLGFRRENVGLALGLALAGLLAVLPVRLFLNLIYQHFHVELRQAVAERLLLGLSGPEFALACVLAVLVVPVCEEFLFRGVIQMGLRKYLGPWGAILVGGVLFAGIHQPWPVSLMLLPLALVLGYLYQRRQSLLEPILLHMLFNSMAVLAAIIIKLS